MGVGLTLLSLTKAQKGLVEKAKSGNVRPYASQWQTFYRLKQAGVMEYATLAEVRLTAAARKHLNI